MGKRQRTWAKKAYQKLLMELGGRCRRCGTLEKLTIHHLYGADYTHNKIEWSFRVSKYRQEAKLGLICVMCDKCNSKIGRPEDWADDPGVYEEPMHFGEDELFHGPSKDEGESDNNPF